MRQRVISRCSLRPTATTNPSCRAFIACSLTGPAWPAIWAQFFRRGCVGPLRSQTPCAAALMTPQQRCSGRRRNHPALRPHHRRGPILRASRRPTGKPARNSLSRVSSIAMLCRVTNRRVAQSKDWAVSDRDVARCDSRPPWWSPWRVQLSSRWLSPTKRPRAGALIKGKRVIEIGRLLAVDVARA